MKKIHIDTSSEYDVIISSGILKNAGKLILEVIPKCRAAIISDDKVFPLYGEIVEKSLTEAGFDTVSFTFKNGEISKNSETYIEILEFLAENKLTRSDIIIALGGGVTGDMAGFAAATYLRGIKFVQIPTTLLAAVDSSVGGKTGINLKSGKNLAGAFHQPSLVICDTDTLSTLDSETYLDGVAEAIKCGMIKDLALFEQMNGNFRDNIEEIIASCVSIKSEVVNCDEFDTGLRQLLNFGHTIGHAVEKCSDFKITHGHAVAIGMAIITKAAEKRGFCENGTFTKVVCALQKCGLPTECGYTADELYSVTLSDKKRTGNTVTLVLPEKCGKCSLYKVSTDELLEYIKKGLEK